MSCIVFQSRQGENRIKCFKKDLELQDHYIVVKNLMISSSLINEKSQFSYRLSMFFSLLTVKK